MHRLASRTATLASAAAIVLLLAGCSSATETDASQSQTAGSTTAPADSTNGTGSTVSPTASATHVNATGGACDLLTVEKITELTGIDFALAEITKDDDSQCDWDLTVTGGVDLVTVMVAEGQGSKYTEYKDAAMSTAGDATDIEIEGASHAFTYLGSLVIGMQVGGDYVQVTYVTSTAAGTDRTKAPLLAAEVAANL